MPHEDKARIPKDKGELVDVEYNNLSAVLEILSWLSKTIVFIFFTPFIAVSSLFTKELFLFIANISLSIAYLVTMAYSVSIEESDRDDIIISLLAMLAIFISLCFFTSGIITFNFGIVSFIYYLNLFSTAINIYSLIKDVVTPPLKNIINGILDFINSYLPDDLTVTSLADKPDRSLDLEHNLVKIRTILVRNYKYDNESLKGFGFKPIDDDTTSCQQRDKISKDVQKITALHKYVKNKLSKHQGHLLGVFTCKDKLKDWQAAKDDLIKSKDATKALKLVQGKIIKKSSKIDRITETIKTLETQNQKKDFTNFDQTVLTIFTDVQRSDIKTRGRQVVANEAYTLLASKREKIEEEISILSKMTP